MQHNTLDWPLYKLQQWNNLHSILYNKPCTLKIYVFMLTSITTVNSPHSNALIHTSQQWDYMHSLCEWDQAVSFRARTGISKISGLNKMVNEY